jgi:hypothetical protein
VVLASMTDVGQLKGFAVPRGLRSLLRRTRSFWGCSRTAPSFMGVVIAALLVPASSWAQPPTPDPPPPGVRGSPPTSLGPDGPPARARTVPPTPPAPIRETVAPPPVEETVVTPPVGVTAAPTPRKQVTQTTPRPQKRAPQTSASPPGRLFVFTEKLARRAPRAAATIQTFSADDDSRPYVLAALSLAVVALGSGTLLTVLSRLRSTRQGLT